MAFNEAAVNTSLFWWNFNCESANLISNFIRNDLWLNLWVFQLEKAIKENLAHLDNDFNLSKRDSHELFALCKIFLKRNHINELPNVENHILSDFVGFLDSSLSFAKNNWINIISLLNFLKILMIRPYTNSIEEKMCLKLFSEIWWHLSSKSVTEKEFNLFVDKVNDSVLSKEFLDIFYFFNSLLLTKSSIESSLVTLDRKIQIEKKMKSGINY